MRSVKVYILLNRISICSFRVEGGNGISDGDLSEFPQSSKSFAWILHILRVLQKETLIPQVIPLPPMQLRTESKTRRSVPTLGSIGSVDEDGELFVSDWSEGYDCKGRG